ncbi:MAG: anti-sigma factor [Marmoricola sp.]
MSTLSCAEFVELVTDYLEGALDADTERRFEAHAEACPGCEVYLDQIRETIAEVGRITPDDLDPDARARLLEAFRGWAGSRPVV